MPTNLTIINLSKGNSNLKQKGDINGRVKNYGGRRGRLKDYFE